MFTAIAVNLGKIWKYDWLQMVGGVELCNGI